MDNDWDFLGTLDAIKTRLNPEIWHVKYMSHPGIGWNIKTILPEISIANDNMKLIIMAWINMCAQFSTIVTWTDVTYDWEGNKILNWQTIWIKDGYDIIEGHDIDNNLVLRLTKANPGQEPIILKLIDNLKWQIAQCTNNANIKELEDLLEITESLLTQTSDAVSRAKRNKIKVIDCE